MADQFVCADVSARNTCNADRCDRPVIARGMCRPHYDRWRFLGGETRGRRSPWEIKKFIDQTLDTKSDDCIRWPFSTHKSGYGIVGQGKGVRWAHRLMLELTVGPPATKQLQAAHNCGNGHLGCVNPRHHEWKTRAQNQRDRVAHGTSNRGTRNPQAKLSEADVLRIVEMRNGGAPLNSVAKTFGIRDAAVCDILHGRSWSWLTGIGNAHSGSS